MISIQVAIQNEEVLVRLETLPKRVREFLGAKLANFLQGEARSALFGDTPGKYLEPKYVRAGTETLGNLLIGYIEADDKPGVYPIFPTKARLLRFISKSGEVVFTRRVLRHPFPKGAPAVEHFFREYKPWLVEQTEDIIFDAVYNAR